VPFARFERAEAQQRASSELKLRILLWFALSPMIGPSNQHNHSNRILRSSLLDVSIGRLRRSYISVRVKNLGRLGPCWVCMHDKLYILTGPSLIGSGDRHAERSVRDI
jgi:hypothetical protein